MVRRIIIDTDPGIDDTVAILLALSSPDVILEGITVTVGNNDDVNVCARNACAILEYMGKYDTPVMVGEGQPLERPFAGHNGKTVHGNNGMGEILIPEPQQVRFGEGAAEFINQKCTLYPGEITILALAPLSNIGRAIKNNPKLPSLAQGIILMGGTFEHKGNISPLAEANIYNDPEAAHIVMQAQWNSLVIIPLNLTHQIRFGSDYLDELFALGNRAGKLASDVNQHYLRFHYGVGCSDCPLHDPTVVMYYLNPSLFVQPTEKVRVYVECEGQLTRGVTIADSHNKFRSLLGDEAVKQHGLASIVLNTSSPVACLAYLKSQLSLLP